MGSHFRSSNDGYGFSLKGSAASTGFAASYQGSWERANDLRFPGGRVHATGFETMQHQILAAMRLGVQLAQP